MDCDSVHLQLEQLQCGRQVDVADAPAAKPQALEASQVRKRRPQCRVGALRPRRIRRPQRQLRQRARQRRRVPATIRSFRSEASAWIDICARGAYGAHSDSFVSVPGNAAGCLHQMQTSR